MLTLLIMSAFHGTKKQALEIAITTLILDGIILTFIANLILCH